MASNKENRLTIIPLSSYPREWDFFVAFGLILAMLFLSVSVIAQVNPLAVGTLPALITEASGLQCPFPGECYTFNDSNDDSRLYRINDEGQFLSQLVIQGVPQVDYEDIAYSQDGQLFIGDFGNNANDRQDLRIYVLSDYSGSVSIPETIEFSLEDQVEFPPSNENLNYDVEAMIHWQDSLFLFTRNRTSPYNGLTKIYSLPDTPGDHVALLRGEIFGNLSETHNSVTAADISPSGNRIAWLTQGSLFLFTSPSLDLAEEMPAYNFFTLSSNYEGISFVDDCNLLLVEEGDPAQIYSLNTCDIITGIGIQSIEDKIQILQRDESLIITSDLSIESLELIDHLGRRVRMVSQEKSLPLNGIKTGNYILVIRASSETHPYRIHVSQNW